MTAFFKSLLVSSIMVSSAGMAQTTLVLQPDSASGKDALLASCVPCGYSMTNYGESLDMISLAWTNGGASSNYRGLVEFDLSSIPSSAVITEAYLSLYHNPNSVEGEHSSLTGSNESVLLKVTSPWEEHEVTWENQPTFATANFSLLEESTLPFQDYTDLEVSSLVQEMVSDPSTNFGFLLRTVTENPYRRMVFASSDHPDPSLRPKLEVTYTYVSSVDESNALGQYVDVYPNPVNDMLTIEYDLLNVTSLELINSVGQTYMNIFNPMNLETIDMSNYPKGISFIKLLAKEGVVVKKVLIE